MASTECVARATDNSKDLNTSYFFFNKVRGPRKLQHKWIPLILRENRHLTFYSEIFLMSEELPSTGWLMVRAVPQDYLLLPPFHRTALLPVLHYLSLVESSSHFQPSSRLYSLLVTSFSVTITQDSMAESPPRFSPTSARHDPIPPPQVPHVLLCPRVLPWDLSNAILYWNSQLVPKFYLGSPC